MKDLIGKVAVITGAASGIGRGMAEAFVTAGMRVVLSDVERPALEATTNNLRAQGGDVHGVVADVSKAQEVRALARAALDKYGAVHVLCNNAGVVAGGYPTWTSTSDDWTWIVGVNLMGVVHGISTFLPIMIEQGEESHIVNTASMAGLTAGGSLYHATKAAVISWSEGVYLQLVQGGFKPRISVVCPAYVDTNIIDSKRNRPAELPDAGPWPSGSEAERAYERYVELHKCGLKPREVGEHVLQAIRDERFYVLTHPAWIAYVEQRAKRIAAGENPAPLSPLAQQ